MGPGSEVEGVGLAFRRTLAPVLLFTVVCLTALNLRSGIASVAPVLGQIQDFFGISSGQAGLLTALPGLCFAAMGLAAVPIARRVGLSRTLAGGTVALVVGLGLRPWVSSFSLFVALTLCVVAGIALANVLLPAWIKQHAGGADDHLHHDVGRFQRPRPIVRGDTKIVARCVVDLVSSRHCPAGGLDSGPSASWKGRRPRNG